MLVHTDVQAFAIKLFIIYRYVDFYLVFVPSHNLILFVFFCNYTS